METSNVAGGLVLRGVLAIVFGIAAVFWPGITLKTFVYLFAAFILINGIVDLVLGITRLFSGTRSFMTRVFSLLIGVIQVGVGVYLLRHLAVTFATLVLLIAFVFIIRGIFEIVESLFGEGTGGYRIMLAVVGALAVLAGIVMLFQPVASGVAFVWILGIYGLITGPLLIAGAMELNRQAAVVTPVTKGVR